MATQGSWGGAQNVRNEIDYQKQRYEGQQGPLANSMGFNYGRGTEADYGNYTDIMNNYRSIYSGGGGAGTSGGGGGGGGPVSNYSAFTVNPERVSAERAGTERATSRSLGPLERVKQSNPFQSYGGFQNFSQTGGFSPSDVANMRARGTAPIRAAYGNAERNIAQQRSLQGGYSPNAIAAQVKMAREQGQGMSDAAQNVEAGIAEQRQRGQLAGLTGMSGIEGQQLNAQMQGDIFNAGQANQGQQFDITNEMNTSQFNAGQGNQVGMFNAGQGNQVGQFNADLGMKGQMYNADAYTRAQAANNAAAESAANRSAASAAASQADRLRALQGATNLYGTTPGMSNMFGQQVSNIVGQGGNFGQNMVTATGLAEQMPGNYDMAMNRIGQFSNMAAPWVDYFTGNRNQQQQNPYYQQQPQYQPNYYTGDRASQGWNYQAPYNGEEEPG
jgi:hypothetical protein